ncbi:MAG: oligosaccharide flippase family protein, partial [Candidatus Bathyarchaeota archaeon]|nr:oligosaccharide flippase family protein [Candidatus Termiticorpusculum sp.]
LVISVFISFIGTYYLAAQLGEIAYGLYSTAIIFPNLLMLFRDWGINQAIVRYTAKYRAENREAEIKSIFIVGILFEAIVGFILSIIIFFMAGYLANNFFLAPEVTLLLKIAAFSILAQGIFTAATAIFTGTEKMAYNSVMLICQSTIKTIFAIALIKIGLGVTGAITGFTLSFTIAALLGIAFIIHLYRKLPKNSTTPYNLNLKKYTKKMLKYATPLAILAILSGVLAQFYALLLTSKFSPVASNQLLIGNYFLAVSFVVLISFFSLPINSLLFPAFSKLDINKDKTTLKNVFQTSVKYSALIVIPVTTIVMCLSTQAVHTIFPDKYELTPIFLTLLSINYLFSAAGSLSVGNIINSQGQTGINLKLNIITAAIGFPLGTLMIIYHGVFGLIFTSIIAPIPSLILSLIWIKKHYNLNINWTSSIKILTSSAITATLTYILINYILNTNPLHKLYTLSATFLNTNLLNKLGYTITALWVSSAFQLTIGTIFFIITFISIIILTKTLSTRDINNLRDMTTSLGPITKIIHIILNTMEKIMKKLKLT